MCLQLADQTLCYPKGILENVLVGVGHSALRVDFVVIETGGNDRAPIILGRPFLSTAKAIIYTDTAKICFTIGDTKERFSFKNRTLTMRVHPQHSYDYLDFDKIPEKKNKVPERKVPERKVPEKKVPVKKNVYTYEGILPTPNKNNNKKGKSKAKEPIQEPVFMVNTIEPPIDPAFSPSHLEKKKDSAVPTIDYMIEESTFYKTFCNIGSSVNIMSTVTYKHLYHDRPLCPTYLQLQLADQSFRFSKGIAKDVTVKIRDQEVPADFMVLDMGEEDDIHLILGRPFIHTTSAIIYMKQGEIHFHFPGEKVRCYFNSYTTYEKPKKNMNRRRRSQRLRQQAIKEEGADQKKEAVEEEAALEAKEEDKFLDKEPQKQKTKKVWRKKEITPLSTPAQEEKSLSLNSLDTQVQIEEKKSGEDSVPLDTPSSA
jgi:hypothetical protein